MKIRMLKNLEVPSANYEKGAIYNIDAHSKEDSGRFETLYTLFVKAGYAEEIKEPQNNFKFDYERFNDFIPCVICPYNSKYKNSEECKDCKFLKNSLKLNSTAKVTKHIEEINHKIIDLIKSL